jgi:anti-anti-sigma regulatory factor
MAQALVTHATVTHDASGTVGTIDHRLSRPAHIVTEPNAPRSPNRHLGTEVFDVAFDGEDHLVVVGDVEPFDAPRLHASIQSISSAGSRSVNIDLSAVTHLGSAAVNVLSAAFERAASHGTTCQLVSPPRSVAQHVLTLVGLPVSRIHDSDLARED